MICHRVKTRSGSRASSASTLNSDGVSAHGRAVDRRPCGAARSTLSPADADDGLRPRSRPLELAPAQQGADAARQLSRVENGFVT